MSEQQEPTNPMVKWAFNLGGAYLGIALAMHFLIYPNSEAYNDAIRKCGRQSEFCACQAQAYVDQRNFLTTPLALVGLVTYRETTSACMRYLN